MAGPSTTESPAESSRAGSRAQALNAPARAAKRRRHRSSALLPKSDVVGGETETDRRHKLVHALDTLGSVIFEGCGVRVKSQIQSAELGERYAVDLMKIY